jgi:hypothetical protein
MKAIIKDEQWNKSYKERAVGAVTVLTCRTQEHQNNNAYEQTCQQQLKPVATAKDQCKFPMLQN